MSELPKTIGLKCPACGKVTIFKLWNAFDNKVDYQCTVCGKVVTISRETAISEERRKIWNALSEMYILLSQGGGKIGLAYDVARWYIHDERLASKIDILMRDLEKIKDEIMERMKK
jgi:DNA-directed RNA polymerase subunit RPC12/RpoP